MNKVIINGNLVKDIDVSITKNDKYVGRFTIANTVGYGENAKTHFIPCTIFGTRVEKLQKLLLKGCSVIVDGSLDINNVKDDKGNWKNYTSVIVNDIDIVKFAKSEAETNIIDYSSMTIEELRAECKANKIRYTMKQNKDQLINLLCDDGDMPF